MQKLFCCEIQSIDSAAISSANESVQYYVSERMQVIDKELYIDGVCQEGRAGRWKWDADLGMMIKVSEKARLTVKMGFRETYYDPGLDEVVTSPQHKKDLLNINGLRIKEKGDEKERIRKKEQRKTDAKKALQHIVRSARMESGGQAAEFTDKVRKDIANNKLL